MERESGEREHADDEIRNREAVDSSSEDSGGSGGAWGPPVLGEKANRDRDAESLVDREPVEAEEGDIPPKDDPSLGRETRGS